MFLLNTCSCSMINVTSFKTKHLNTLTPRSPNKSQSLICVSASATINASLRVIGRRSLIVWQLYTGSICCHVTWSDTTFSWEDWSKTSTSTLPCCLLQRIHIASTISGVINHLEWEPLLLYHRFATFHIQ